MAITARVEYFRDGAWHQFIDVFDCVNVCVAEAQGLIEARRLWRNKVDGVRVSVITQIVVLERKR